MFALFVVNRLFVVFDGLCEGLATLIHRSAHLLIIKQSLAALVPAVVVSLGIPMGVPFGAAIECG